MNDFVLDDVILGPKVSDVKEPDLQMFVRVTAAEPLRALGVELTGSSTNAIFVEDQKKGFGRVVIHAQGENNIFFFGGKNRQNNGHVIIRIVGSNVKVIMPDFSFPFNFHDIFLRSSRQTLFVGKHVTSVGTRIEMEGAGRQIVIGDDCMFSSDVNIRNYDMHTVFNIDDGSIVNSVPHNVLIQKHVWLGYRSVISGAELVETGSVVGACSFVNRNVPAFSAVGGVAAKVIKTRVSWSRDVNEVDEKERERARALLASSVPGEP